MKIIVYTKNNCPYCVYAKALLEKHNMEYVEVDGVEHREDMMSHPNVGKTFPQIIMDGRSIGGYDQLKLMLEKGDNSES